MKFFQILGFVVQILPMMLQMIKSVEEAVPGGGNGKDKMSMVRQALEVVVQESGDLKMSFEEIWPTLEKIIGIAVRTFNATGIFSK